MLITALNHFRSLRNIKGSQYASIIGVVKRSWIEKDETALLSLLKFGFNKVRSQDKPTFRLSMTTKMFVKYNYPPASRLTQDKARIRCVTI